MNENKYVDATRQRLISVRLRTWTLTLAIIVTLIFYFLANVVTRQSINWIDFVLLCILQIVVHSLYFPDGEVFGQKDKTFIDNRKSYNDKANDININGDFSQLREYCKYEYEERKQRYIEKECSFIGITNKELEHFKQQSEEEIKGLTSYEIEEIVNGEKKSRILFFSKYKRKRLYNLIFKPLPIEENHPETIMSAVENNGNRAIKDTSILFKAQSYIRKIFTAVVIGGIFAYIGYTVRDGFGFEQIVSISMYLTTLFTTAVMAFTSGETCIKVHKNHFYVELSNFIDNFIEWNKNQKKESV
jgi:hypothetical protein